MQWIPGLKELKEREPDKAVKNVFPLTNLVLVPQVTIKRIIIPLTNSKPLIVSTLGRAI